MKAIRACWGGDAGVSRDKHTVPRVYGQSAYWSARRWCAAYSRFVYTPVSPILKFHLMRRKDAQPVSTPLPPTDHP